jgi:hypothetical protein
MTPPVLLDLARGRGVRNEFPMYRVMIRCSITNQPVATGLTSDADAWNTRPLGINRAICSECKQFHSWRKTDAWLEGEAAQHS